MKVWVAWKGPFVVVRLQTKLALLILGFGGITLLLIAGAYYFHAREVDLRIQRSVLEEAAVQRAEHLDVLLREKAKTVAAIGAAPVLVDALQASNARLGGLDETQRQARIEGLDSRWRTAAPTSDLVTRYTGNTPAAFLARHQLRLPREYGEIFVTDRYGALVASTAKLTTFAHGHKYWWRAAYGGGDPRVFFDDRGFDTSVGGYVLGVVVPIVEEGDFLGIIKANVNILGPIAEVIERYNRAATADMQLVRSGGMVVYAQGAEPLSSRVAPVLQEALGARGPAHRQLGGRLVAFAPVAVTLGGSEAGFGGSYASIDHIHGNTGEAWLMVASADLEVVLEPLQRRAREIVAIGAVVIAVLALAAIAFARRIAAPVVRIGDAARRVGGGDFAVRVRESDDDELGQLGAAFNRMVSDLESTTTSRDHMADEVELRRETEGRLRASERLLLAFLNGIREAAFFIEPDGTIVQANKALAERFGKRPEQIIGANIFDMTPPEVSAERRRRVAEAVAGKTAVRFQDRRADLELENSVYPIVEDDGAVRHLVVLSVDITEMKRAERELRQLTARLARRNKELSLLHRVSEATSETIELAQLFPRIAEAVGSVNVLGVASKIRVFVLRDGRLELAFRTGPDPACVERDSGGVTECLCGLAAETGEVIVTPDAIEDPRHCCPGRGDERHGNVVVPLRAKGELVGVLSLHTPPELTVSEEQMRLLLSLGAQIGMAVDNARLYEEARQLALRDPLSGLGNRRLMESMLEKAVARAGRGGFPLAVLMLDVDDFKRYNDTHGHEAGDRVIRQLGSALREHIRGGDFAARYGGEEFFVLLPDTDAEEAEKLAERLRRAIATAAGVTVSVGVGVYTDGMDPAALVHRADDALYAAKRAGKDRVLIADDLE